MDEIQIKALVRERDGLRCVECGTTNEQHVEQYGRQLDVHRKEPGSAYTLEGCVAICKRCHARQPKLGKQQYGVRGKVFAATIGPELMQACTEFMASLPCRVEASVLMRTALEDFLHQRGFWPPKKGNGN